jgi:ABC-type glycerol-3-phosphate transport system permease component
VLVIAIAACIARLYGWNDYRAGFIASGCLAAIPVLQALSYLFGSGQAGEQQIVRALVVTMIIIFDMACLVCSVFMYRAAKRVYDRS